MTATATYRGGGYLAANTNVTLNADCAIYNPVVAICAQFGATALATPSDTASNPWVLEGSYAVNTVQISVWSTSQRVGAITTAKTIALTGNAAHPVLWSAWELGDVEYSRRVVSLSTSLLLNNIASFEPTADPDGAQAGISIHAVTATTPDVTETWGASLNLQTTLTVYDSMLASTSASNSLSNRNTGKYVGANAGSDAATVTVKFAQKKPRQFWTPRVQQANNRASSR